MRPTLADLVPSLRTLHALRGTHATLREAWQGCADPEALAWLIAQACRRSAHVLPLAVASAATIAADVAVASEATIAADVVRLVPRAPLTTPYMQAVYCRRALLDAGEGLDHRVSARVLQFLAVVDAATRLLPPATIADALRSEITIEAVAQALDLGVDAAP